jgi:hypothetical protein
VDVTPLSHCPIPSTITNLATKLANQFTEASASEIPPDALAEWQQYPPAVPIDINSALRQPCGGHLEVTPQMRGDLPSFVRDVLAPGSMPYFFRQSG